MYRIVGIKVHPSNDNEIEFVSEEIRDPKIADEFYGIILNCNVFYIMRLEQNIGGMWFTIS